MIANTLDSMDKENVGNNAATVERKKGKKKGATAALQDAPTMRSKVFQSLLCIQLCPRQRLNVNKKANMKAQLEAKIILLRKEKDTNLVEFGVMNSASNNSMSQTFQALQNAAVFNLSQEEIGELQAKWRTAYAAQDALKENYQQKTADLVAQIKDTEAQLAAAALTALPSTSSVKKVKKEKAPPASAKKLFMPSAAGSMNTPKS